MPITSRHIHLSIAFISLAVILGFIILYIWDPDYEFFPNHLPTHPIVIVPGLFGSRLKTCDWGNEWNRSKIESLCNQPENWQNDWLDGLIDGPYRYLEEKLQGTWWDLGYNHTTKRFHDVNKSVDVSAFGNVVCCTNMLGPEHGLLPDYDHALEYFEPMVSALETKAGYERDQNIFAGPYDWRYGGDSLGLYYKHFKQLIEEVHDSSGDVPVILLSHSMGSPVMSHFLVRQSKRWRRKYIRSLVSLAGAWGGTVMSLEALLSKKVATMPSSIDVPAQHFESPYWLMPAKDAFGEEIVATLNLPTTNGIDASYSMSNITQLFFLKAMNNFTTGGVNYTEIGIRYEAVGANSRSGKRLETEAPDVEIYCLYSVDVDTAKTVQIVGEPEGLAEPWAEPNKLEYSVKYGDGDGTVNAESLSQCRKWSEQRKGAQQPLIHYDVLAGVKHAAMVTGERAQDKVVDIVSSINRARINLP